MNCVRGKRKGRKQGVYVMNTVACSLKYPLINKVKNTRSVHDRILNNETY